MVQHMWQYVEQNQPLSALKYILPGCTARLTPSLPTSSTAFAHADEQHPCCICKLVSPGVLLLLLLLPLLSLLHEVRATRAVVQLVPLAVIV